MRKMCLLLVLMLIFAGSAYAEKYVYWNGVIDEGTWESLTGDEAENGLLAWDCENDKHFFLGVDATPIESDIADGILAVGSFHWNEFPNEITVYHCRDAAVLESYKIALPDAVERVLAIKDGWIYYIYVEMDEMPAEVLNDPFTFRSNLLEYAKEIGVRRYHAKDQIVQSYADIPGVSHAWDIPEITVGKDGDIAYEMQDGEFIWFAPSEDARLLLYTAKPEADPQVIVEVASLPNNYNEFCPLYLDDGRLLYVNPLKDGFMVYDGAAHEELGADETVLPNTEYAVDSENQYMVHHIGAPERVIGEIAFFRLQLISLTDGREIRQSEIWAWYNEGLQFGN